MEKIRLAAEPEFDAVRDFYWALIDEMQASPFAPGWEKGVYPSDDFLKEALRKNWLYVMEQDGRIASAMVLNRQCNEGYAGTEWRIDAEEDEVTVIHALGVSPAFHGRGFAEEMVKEAIHTAKTQHQKAIRLDVLNGNLPALKLYEKLGFQHRRTVRMFYEDTGWTDFLLYELVL